MAEDPITGVCVVADKEKCPDGYQVIETTTDNQDADLWKDKMLRKRVTRYLCFTKKCNLAAGNNVLVDIIVIKENESIPAGYSCISTTHDSGDAVLKKRLLVIRLFNRTSTEKAISAIYLTSSKTKAKPVEVSARGDINGINLYLRMSTVRAPSGAPDGMDRRAPVPAPRQNLPRIPSTGGLPSVPPPQQPSPVQLPPIQPSHAPPTHSQPQSPGAGGQMPYSWDKARGFSRKASTLRTSTSLNSESDVLSAIEGVPFQINPVLQTMSSLSNYDVPCIPYKSMGDIERQFYYDFSFESQTKQRLTMCDSP